MVNFGNNDRMTFIKNFIKKLESMKYNYFLMNESSIFLKHTDHFQMSPGNRFEYYSPCSAFRLPMSKI